MSRPERGAPLLAPGVPARRHFRNGGPHWSSNNASRKTRNAELGGPRGPFVLVAADDMLFTRNRAPHKCAAGDLVSTHCRAQQVWHPIAMTAAEGYHVGRPGYLQPWLAR